MEPTRRTDISRARHGLAEIARFDFDNASILQGGSRRRTGTNSTGSAEQLDTAPKKTGPFSFAVSGGSSKAFSTLFSNKRRKKDHTPAGLAYETIEENPAREFKSISTTRDVDALKSQQAQEAVRDSHRSPPRSTTIFTFGRHQPEYLARTSFTFGSPPRLQQQPQRLKLKQRQQNGLTHTARQAWKQAQVKKDSKDLLRETKLPVDSAVSNTCIASASGPIPNRKTDKCHNAFNSVNQKNFLDQMRQVGSNFLGKRKDDDGIGGSISNIRKRARTNEDSAWRPFENPRAVPPIPTDHITRTTSISIDSHIGEQPQYSVPPPHLFEYQPQQPPAPIPLVPGVSHPTQQNAATDHRMMMDPEAIAVMYEPQVAALARHQCHQLPPIVENAMAEQEDTSTGQDPAEADHRKTSALKPIDEVAERDAEQPLTSATGRVNQGDDLVAPLAEIVGYRGELEDLNSNTIWEEGRLPRSTSSSHQFRMHANDHRLSQAVSAMSAEYVGNGSPVSSIFDVEMDAEQDRLSLAASQQAMAEVDEERESLRLQFEQFSWCHGQEEEFGTYALAADQQWTPRSSSMFGN